MNKVLFLLLLSLVLLPLHVFVAGVGPSWTPIRDVKDPHVVAIGEFAVSAYNRLSKSGLKFVRVVRGESQTTVSSVNYLLEVAVNDGGGPIKTYGAVVFEKPWLKSMNLISFMPININGRFL